MLRSGESPVIAWLAIGFFGLGVLVSAVLLLPGASRLTLDRDGFTTQTLFRSHRVAWRDASNFGLSDGLSFEGAPYPRMVAFEYAGQRHNAIADLVRSANAGRNGALPDTFGLTADALVELMKKWRERALGAP